MIQTTTFFPFRISGSRNMSWKVLTVLPAIWVTLTG